MEGFIQFLIEAKAELIYVGSIYIVLCLAVNGLDKFYHPYGRKKIHTKKNKSKR